MKMNLLTLAAFAVTMLFAGCDVDALTDNETYNVDSGNTMSTNTTTTTTTTETNTDSQNVGQTDETAVLGIARLEAGFDPDTGEPIPTSLEDF